MERDLLILEGGCHFDKEDLSPVEWQALAILKQWQAEKKNV